MTILCCDQSGRDHSTLAKYSAVIIQVENSVTSEPSPETFRINSGSHSARTENPHLYVEFGLRFAQRTQYVIHLAYNVQYVFYGQDLMFHFVRKLLNAVVQVC